MISRSRIDYAVALALVLGACISASPLRAQGADNPEAIDRIIGSRVTEEKASATADPKKLVAAIEKTPQAIETVRKTSDLGQVDIVFLEDAAENPPPEVAAELEKRKTEIDALRKELEGNAMLFHAIDSRDILLRDILAVEFEGTNKAVIYAAAKPPGQ